MSLLDAFLSEGYRTHVWVWRRQDGILGDGSAQDPYDGSTQARFDDIMANKLPADAPVTVHLGPGTFDTSGYCDGVTGGWSPRPAMKIVGSGIDVTTLRLVGAADPQPPDYRHYFVIGHPLASGGSLMDSFEVGELTIDCNLSDLTGSRFACGAVRLMGNHARVRRVKVVNWGTKTSARPCHVVAMIVADPAWTAAEITNSGIDERIAVLPGNGTATPITVFHVGAKADPAAALEGAGWGGFIRNCFVDGASLALTADVRALSMNWCRGGVVERNQVHNVQWGGPCLEKANGRELIIRDNVFRNVRKGPFLNLGTKSGTQVGVSAISFVAISGGSEATVTTQTNHNLAQGDGVLLQCTPSDLSGLFAVTQSVNAIQFKYRILGGTQPPAFGSGTLEKIFGTRKIVIEGGCYESFCNAL
jgi:hypothetical protein